MKKRALALAASVVAGATMIAVWRAPAGAAEADLGVLHDPAAVPAGTYAVDPLHSALTGNVGHSGLSHFAFRFKRFDARFTFDPAKPDSPHVEVAIDPSSLDTNVAGFDTNLATSDRHFNVSKFPKIVFISDSLQRTGADKGVMTGTVTFLGITKPLAFDVTFLGVAKGRNGATVGLSATTTIRRSDFGFAQGSQDLDDNVSVFVDAEFLQQRTQRPTQP